MNVETLIQQREQARKKKQFDQADAIRKQIETLGYTLTDTTAGPKADKTVIYAQKQRKKPGFIALFGSGETSPTGRRIHEYLIKDFPLPVNIALLETPSGFEDSPHIWYQRLKAMMEVGLANFKPQISLVPALDKQSTNDETIVKPLLRADYIHTGAGSPTYAINHLKDSKAYQYLIDQNKKGTVLSFASAAAIAMGKYALPIYELYKVGEDPHWIEGLNFFGQSGLNLAIVPHWNNTEGGRDIDTSRCFMGKRRFKKLLSLLPKNTTVLGIDEHTAIVFNVRSLQCSIIGVGILTLIKEKNEVVYATSNIRFNAFTM